MNLDHSALDALHHITYAASRDESRPQCTRNINFDGDAAFCFDNYRAAIAWLDGEPAPRCSLDPAMLRSTTTGCLPLTNEELSSYWDLAWRPLVARLRWVWALTIDRTALVNACRGITRTKNRNDQQVMRFDPDGTIWAGTRKDWIGSVVDQREIARGATVHANEPGVPAQPVIVNSVFFRDIATHHRASLMTIEFDTPNCPITIREPGISHILMPLRATW